MDYKKLSYILTVVACITLIGMGVVLFVIFADVQAQLKEQKKASHEAISQRDQNNDQNDTSQNEVARLKEYVTKLTGDVTKLTGDVTKLTGQMVNSKREMKRNLGFVTNHLNESTKEMDKLKIQLTTLNDSRDEVSDLQTRISQLESQLTSKRINEIVEKALPKKWKFCGAGVQSTSIVADDQLTASTSTGHNPALNARLLGKVGGNGVWCSSSRQANDWIQVDFEQQRAISGVVTQGYHGGDQRVTSYKVSYQRTNEGFTTITDQSGSVMVFQGNEDSNTPVAHDFPTEITARYFRIIVVTWNTWPCLRFDYLTC